MQRWCQKNNWSLNLANTLSPDCNGILFSFSEKRYRGKQEMASKTNYSIRSKRQNVATNR
jgi:hypothetical protein